MNRSRVRNLGARLMRSRAASLLFGERRFFVHPLDLPVGHPTDVVARFLNRWQKPYRSDIPEFSFLDAFRFPWSDCGFPFREVSAVGIASTEPGNVQRWIVDDCCDFLHATGQTSGWFRIKENACLLGSSAFVHVRDFDLLCTTCDLFDHRLDGGIFATAGDGQLVKRHFVPMVGPPPRQRFCSLQSRKASNFPEVAYV